MTVEKENFQSSETTDTKREKVRVIPVRNIDDFPEQPFKLKDDEDIAKRPFNPFSAYNITVFSNDVGT